jgi:hypothetical protein
VGHINNGTYAFFYDKGTFDTFVYPGKNTQDIRASGINNKGIIAGLYVDEIGKSHGFFKKGSKFTSVEYPGALNTYLIGINNNGEMVGSYDTVPNGPRHGFIYKNKKFTQFNIPNYSNINARGITDDGRIVGRAYDAEGNSHGFLALPDIYNDIHILLDKIGSKLDNAGVQTAATVPEILNFIEANFDPTPKASALTKIIAKAGGQIDSGKLKAAIGQLKNADKKTDGGSNDLVQGQKVAELNLKIKGLKTSLEQEVSFAYLSAMIEAANDQVDAGNSKMIYKQLSNADKKTYNYSCEYVDDKEAEDLATIIQEMEKSLGLPDSLASSTPNISQNPVPPTVWLLGSGLLGLLGWRRFRKG